MNEHLVENLINSTRVFEGRMISVRVDNVQLPTGKKVTREVVEHPGAVAVVAIREDKTVVMVRQYRHPANKILLEIPAGKLDKDENPDACAVRELEEETGYKAAIIRKLATVYTTPGFTDELMHIYIAEGLSQSQQNTDEDEFIDVDYYTPQQLKAMIQAGQIEDAKTLLGLFMAGVLK